MEFHLLFVVILGSSALISLGSLAYLFWRIRNSSTTANWFMIAMILNAGVSLASLGAMTVPSSAASADLLAVTNVLSILYIAATLFFAARLTNRDRWFRTFYGPFLMALPTLLSLCFAPVGALHSHPPHVTGGLSPSVVGGPFVGLFSFFYMVSAISTSVLLISYYRTLKDATKRREIALVLGGWASVLVGSTLYYMLELSFRHLPYFPVNIPLTALVSVVIVYALTRYGVSVFNPNDVAANIIGAIPGAMLILDHRGTVIFANEATKELLEKKSSQLLGSSVEHVFATSSANERFREHVLDYFASVPTSSQTTLEDISLRSGDELNRPFNISATCSRDNHGNVVNIVLICIGIEQLKEAQDRLSQEKASVEPAAARTFR